MIIMYILVQTFKIHDVMEMMCILVSSLSETCMVVKRFAEKEG